MLIKRGQLTIFVLVAILIAVAIFVYFFLFSGISGSGFVDSDISPVYDTVVNCLDDSSNNAILELGASGGFYDLPEKVNGQDVPYYFYEDEGLMPSISVYEDELEKYIYDAFLFCVRDSFSLLNGYEVYYNLTDVSVEILEDDTISVSVDFPFGVFFGNNSYYFDRLIENSYDVRLYSIHSFANQVILWQEEEPNGFCINCIGDLSYEEELIIDLYSFEENDVTFLITDNTTKINGEPYMLFFAIKYLEDEDYDVFERLRV